MEMIVEINSAGRLYDLTLDYDTFAGMGLSKGSWECNARLISSDGGFRVDDDVLWLHDVDVHLLHLTKRTFTGDAIYGKIVGRLANFGEWIELWNGKSGDGTLTFDSVALLGRPQPMPLYVRWRIKSGAPLSKLKAIPAVKQP